MGSSGSSSTDLSIHLGDGRLLAYATWGDSEGKSVFLFHGSPGSRLFCPSESVTASSGVRLITVDRPGCGRSAFQENRSILDWPIDVATVADELGIERFAVVGYSSGGPYALACAARMPSRVRAVGLVSTTVPFDEIPKVFDEFDTNQREFVDLAREDPVKAMSTVQEGAAWLEDDPGAFLQFPRPEPDRLVLEDPSVRTMYLESVRESVHQGLRGYAWDEVLCGALPWGFSLKDIDVDVHIWHGDQDPYIPRAHIEYMAGLIPKCQTTFYADEAHGLIAPRWEEILSTFTSGKYA